MKISSNIIKAVVKIWETYPELYFNLMFIRKLGGLFDGEIEIMSTTPYVMYKAVIVPPYGTLEDGGLEEIAINIPDLVQFVQGREETVDMEVKSDGLVLNGKFIPAHQSLVDYRNSLRAMWAEDVVTAERRATAQPVDDLLSEYAKVYKSLSPYRKRKLKDGSERLTIGFNLHSGEQYAFHEVPDDDGDFFVKKSWQLNTMNLDTSHMQDFDAPMRYFNYMYLKPVFESALDEFVELHFHQDYKKGLVCVSEGRIGGSYHQATALIMPISYIKFEEVKNE